MRIRRIAYSLGTLTTTKQILMISRKADKNNRVDSIWVPESWGREAFSSLGAISKITNRVKLGTSIVSVFSRSPATVAMSAATVDKLSNIRMIIGLGVSTPALAENWHGVRFEKPVERMKEFVECVRLILTGEKVSYNGRFFVIKDFRLSFKPIRSNIPIFVAAINERMVLLSSLLADGILLYLRPDYELRKTVSFIRSNSGKKHFEIACVFIGAISNKNPEKARERAAKTLAFYTSVGQYYNKFLSENGFRNEVQGITDEYNKRGLNSAYKMVSDKMLDSLTICGNQEACLRALKRFVSTGISLPIIQINPLDEGEKSIKDILGAFNNG
jgi:5,10-methylenetetrahydromethanopterin reductase